MRPPALMPAVTLMPVFFFSMAFMAFSPVGDGRAAPFVRSRIHVGNGAPSVRICRRGASARAATMLYLLDMFGPVHGGAGRLSRRGIAAGLRRGAAGSGDPRGHGHSSGRVRFVSGGGGGGRPGPAV